MTHRPIRRRRQPNASMAARNGSILIVAMIALGVVSALAIAMLRSSHLQSRQARQELHRAQAECLLDAGLDRAVYELHRHPEYKGETWDLSGEQIVGRHAGQVTIRVASDASSEVLTVEVIAEYPLGSPASVRRSRSYHVSK